MSWLSDAMAAAMTLILLLPVSLEARDEKLSLIEVPHKLEDAPPRQSPSGLKLSL